MQTDHEEAIDITIPENDTSSTTSSIEDRDSVVMLGNNSSTNSTISGISSISVIESEESLPSSRKSSIIAKKELFQAWRERGSLSDKDSYDLATLKEGEPHHSSSSYHSAEDDQTADNAMKGRKVSNASAVNATNSLPTKSETAFLNTSPRGSRSSSKTGVGIPNIPIEEIKELDNEEKEQIKEQLQLQMKAKSKRGSSTSEKTVKKNVVIGVYQLGEVLGRGASGVVYKALNLETGDFVAVKQVVKKNLKHPDISAVQRELGVLQKVQHPNIVRLFDCIETPEKFNLVFEYIENGSLTDILMKFGAFPESLAAVYTHQLLTGLSFLHEKGLLHRDIKGSNILITKEGIIKLSDFGVAAEENLTKDSPEFGGGGSPYWLAPEVIEETSFSKASDIWSVGCTVYELITCSPPYFDLNPVSAMWKIIEDNHPPLPTDISEELRDFLLKCFQKPATVRAPAKELLNHVWLQSHVNASKSKRQSKTVACQSFDDLRDAVIQYNQNQHNRYRYQTLRGSFNNPEDNIDYTQLLQWPPPNSRTSLRQSVPRLERKFSESQRKSLSLGTLPSASFSIVREGYLKSKNRYWCCIMQNIPLLSYYKKKESFQKGKSPKGQILLVGSVVQKSNLVKKEPFGFTIQQRDGKLFYLCTETEEEQNQWMEAIATADTLNTASQIEEYKATIQQQELFIKKLQKGLQTLLDEKEGKSNANNKIKRPSEQFYKEFFFFLALSVKRNDAITSSINIHDLYNKAEREHIPFHMWYQWIPDQISKLVKGDRKLDLRLSQEPVLSKN